MPRPFFGLAIADHHDPRMVLEIGGVGTKTLERFADAGRGPGQPEPAGLDVVMCRLALELARGVARRIDSQQTRRTSVSSRLPNLFCKSEKIDETTGQTVVQVQ